MPRVLVIMGSGEITPGMLGVHRRTFAAIDPSGRRLVMDSPFAFQANADELVHRISSYFAQSLGQHVERVRLPVGAEQLALERALAQIAAASWVFAGPGSPSYARRAWAGTPVPDALARVVAPGRAGALVFASAAAVTLGNWSLPVYEIYKVGMDPSWEPGLGLMDQLVGLRCAVLPHYDNSEGGTHDTRYCWIGHDRLARIEDQLHDGFILGIDERTALLVDLDTGRCVVQGRGGVTVRVMGAQAVLPSGSQFPVQRIGELADELRGGDGGGDAPAAFRPHDGPTEVVDDPLDDRHREARPVAPGSVPELADVVLSALPVDSPARAALVVLADLATGAAQVDARSRVTPFVEALMVERAAARAALDWGASDRIRDTLVGLGVQVQDSRDGSRWEWQW